jgi:cation/acetate symporter
VGLIVLSKSVWVDVLGHAHAVFPYVYPTLFSLPAALLFAFVVSLTDRSVRGQGERQAFQAQFTLSEWGPGSSIR